MTAICTHLACPLSPVGAAGSSGSSTCSLARFLHCLAFDRLDFISQEGVQFTVNFTEKSRRATETADNHRRNEAINEGTVAKTDTIIEHQLLLQITSDLVTNAENGQGNLQISTEIYPHVQTISKHIRDLPPALGVEIQALARTVHVDRGKELFTELVKDDSYEDDMLLEMAFYTYDVHHDVDELFTHLEEAKAETDIGAEKAQIRNFKQTLANLYQNSSTQLS